jgi:hypothetical protein
MHASSSHFIAHQNRVYGLRTDFGDLTGYKKNIADRLTSFQNISEQVIFCMTISMKYSRHLPTICMKQVGPIIQNLQSYCNKDEVYN